MRLLLAEPPAPSSPPLGSDLDQAALLRLYAAPGIAGGWLRANFAMSLDGAVTGADGRSGTVNTDADHVVFRLLRALSDAVVVGAGTVRGEGYTPLSVDDGLTAARAASGAAPDLPLVVVTGRGTVPVTLRDAAPGRVLLATTSRADGLAESRELLGDDHVLVCGRTDVDPARLVAQLHERGMTRLLTEGGPSLLTALLRAGVVDELCVSVTPLVVGGGGPRLTSGGTLTGDFTPRLLVEQDGTLMGRWVRADR
ncbi:MAG: dihydrofolate reductase family protein [Actinomycetota bacterium]|nr:dihydrofolate reductase family protein [Actinomycetota bacterium]